MALAWARHAWVAVLLAAASASPAARAEGLLLVTEDNPPYNFADPNAPGRIGGFVAEIVALTMERAGVPYTTEMLPWEEAYAKAQAQPGTCVYGISQSPERLPLFRWVGPLAEGQFAIFGKADRSPIASLEELRGARIGVQANGPFERLLRERGFAVTATTKEALFPLLRDGGIDFVALGLRNGRWFARQAKVPIRVLMRMLGPQLALACHPETDPALLARMNAALGDLHADGTAGRILARYE